MLEGFKRKRELRKKLEEYALEQLEAGNHDEAMEAYAAIDRLKKGGNSGLENAIAIAGILIPGIAAPIITSKMSHKHNMQYMERICDIEFNDNECFTTSAGKQMSSGLLRIKK